MRKWISTTELAALAGITRQSAHEAIKKSISNSDYMWRKFRLTTRSIPGRGGKSGASYEVAIKSLPTELQERAHEIYDTAEAPSDHVEGPLNPSKKATSAAKWWGELLGPILAHPKGSRERAAAMKVAAAQRVPGPDGEWFTPSLRDIQRKVRAAEVGGLRGLRRKRREVKPESRVVLTRRWDALTASLGRAAQTDIARETREFIRDRWGSGARLDVVKRLASEDLAIRTAEKIGARYDEILPDCKLPRHVVDAGKSARRVHEYRTNIKKWDDERPRVRLTSAGLAPMQLVFGDVHHFDIYVRREDGSLATPKGIAWLDAATRRIKIDLVLCEPGTAVRNADLIESFIAVTQHPCWGMMGMLYLDNGSEYRFAEFLPDALKLAGLDCEAFDRGKPLIRATAYNAAAKGIIEGTFRIIEEKILAPLKGYIGGDRMNSRKSNLGKAPEPFDGTFTEFCYDFDGLLTYYNSNRQSGDLKGLSPQQAYTEAVEQGWQRTDVDPLALMMAFSVEDTRKVVDGKISVEGRTFYCDELARHTGNRVRIHRPKYLSWNAVPVLTMKGDLIGVAHPDEVFHRLDPRGAEEASRRKRVARAAIAAEAADLRPIDVKQEMIASGARQPLPPIPTSKGVIGIAPEKAEMGRRIMESPADRRDREHEAKQAKLLAAIERGKKFGGAL